MGTEEGQLVQSFQTAYDWISLTVVPFISFEMLFKIYYLAAEAEEYCPAAKMNPKTIPSFIFVEIVTEVDEK